MKLSKFNYSVAQARKNMVRNGLMTIASLFTICSCLLILGLFTVLTLNVNYISEQIQDQCEIQLFINKEVDEARVTEIGDEILKIPNVEGISLFSKEDTLEYVQDNMFEGNEELANFEDDNPFRDSYKIILSDISRTDETVQQLENIKDVAHVQNSQDVVNAVISMSNTVKKLSVVIMALLLVVAVVIIANTIKLTVFNRRKEINIMKYIGATDRFIRVPFVLEGIMIGLLGAVVSFGLISWGYIALTSFLESMQFDVFEFITYVQLAPVIGGAFVAVGCLIGILGSAISMRKYLKV